MKIRLGFVSNSSTSSFLIYGCYFDTSKVNGEDIDEKVSSAKNGLSIEWGQEDSIYVGEEPTSCPDNMTMGEWKESISAKIKELFGEDIKCGWHSEAYYDG